ncbi:MAG: 4a-hydroxytetrahydrobiopterin dehydratase [Chlorobiales bacterium]|nr:4a-hydroxytetrahydrobiopterin dehydratase [Chlorobiales bacterium]
MNELKNKTCVPCTEGLAPISATEIKKLLVNIPEWEVTVENGINQLQRTFTFPDFKNALAFTNQVGALAEAEQHHPKLITEWGKVTVIWWTHAAKGLHMNDFIMAARTSELKAG